jgi:multisubunit Na+/H+ antiporter MnhB subunit
MRIHVIHIAPGFATAALCLFALGCAVLVLAFDQKARRVPKA